MSSGSRSCCRRSDPLSFHGSVFGSLRPLGYSGVSETHSRPRSSQSMFMALWIRGSAATSVRSNSGCTSIFPAALARSGRSTFDVAQVVAELVLRQELVGVGALAGPGDPAQQNRAVVRPIEILERCPGIETKARYGVWPPSMVRS